MAKRISTSQFKSKLRQIQNKQRQAIEKYNHEVRKYNQNVKQAINKYNQEVRAHNSRVRSNRQRLKTELRRLSQQKSTGYITYRSSVVTLNETYSRLNKRSETGSIESKYNHYLDLSEKEAANSVEVLNFLLSPSDYQSANYLTRTTITDELQNLSLDLHNRWCGAIFALNPDNPDAARHFCTSAREIITQILEIEAPDREVIHFLPECEYTDQGKPTRKSKITYLLHSKGLTDDDFGRFVDFDIQNIIELFQIFNDGTHGSAGKFNLYQLSTIKKRVEDGILFLTQLAN